MTTTIIEHELGKASSAPKPEAAVAKTGKPTKKEQEENPPFKFEQQAVRYENVIGMKRQKLILHKLLELPLRKARDFESLGMKRSVGVILYGPPGTGKTFLSKAACGELDVPMCYVKVSSVMSKYVGESSKRVHELFEAARTKQPCAVFIDEADILLQSRDDISGEGGSHELKQAVSQMLQEVSEVHDDRKSHIYMLAATNMPWSIDPAHKRSGRFEYLLYVRAPEFRERMALFRLYLDSRTWSVVSDGNLSVFLTEREADAFAAGQEKAEAKLVITKQLRSDQYGRIDFFTLALATPDFSPADIEKVCKVAKLNAIEHERVLITTRSVQKALWSREAGRSSLDDWYIGMNQKYLPKRKSIIRSLISARYRDREEQKVKFDKADVKIYEQLVNDVKRHMRWQWVIRVQRIFGRGFP